MCVWQEENMSAQTNTEVQVYYEYDPDSDPEGEQFSCWCVNISDAAGQSVSTLFEGF